MEGDTYLSDAIDGFSICPAYSGFMLSANGGWSLIRGNSKDNSPKA